MARRDDDHQCALCGKSKKDGRKIIVGLHGAVCTNCVDLCSDILLAGGESAVPSTPQSARVLVQLLRMTMELARPAHAQVILGEGNTSARDGENLWIKATGHQMPDLTIRGFVQVDLGKVIQTLEGASKSDEERRTLLNDARTDPNATNFPSTETFMHAWLLSLPDVNFVAHTHPVTTLGVMCGPKAREFAGNRYFPDQIVLCGPRSVFVPYCAPGFDLAIAIRDACTQYTKESGLQPKTILLENHGLIALGKTAKEPLAACLMMEKAANVFSTAGEAHALTGEEVRHIHEWTDEHFRQGKIWED